MSVGRVLTVWLTLAVPSDARCRYTLRERVDPNQPVRDRKNRIQVSSPWVSTSQFFSEQGLTHKIDKLYLKVHIYEEEYCFYEMFVIVIERIQLYYVQ